MTHACLWLAKVGQPRHEQTPNGRSSSSSILTAHAKTASLNCVCYESIAVVLDTDRMLGRITPNKV